VKKKKKKKKKKDKKKKKKKNVNSAFRGKSFPPQDVTDSSC
jgi:hypothetical protein